MFEKKGIFDFLFSKPAMIVTGVLVAQLVLFHSVPTDEFSPNPPPLGQFAASVGPWQTVREMPIDSATENVLKADDTLNREYAGPGEVNLFIAFFKSQRAGVSPHSPKVCLPSSGWMQESSGTISINVPGEPSAIPVNRYIVSHDEQRSLVFYWYQSAHRVMANEYLSKFSLIFDSLRYHRSDEALIRVITPIGANAKAGAEEHALQFIQTIYQPLKQQMWVGSARAQVR